ncbi:MAG: caspase family protein [Myxococcales bacterium]
MSLRALAIAAVAGSTLLAAGCATAAATGEKGGPKLVPFAPVEESAAAARPKKLAMLVGVDAFEDERFKALKYAAADAQALASALSGFDAVDLRVEPAKTSRAAILEGLQQLAAKARDPRDTVVLYFSTHGSLGRKPGGPLRRYLVSRDTRLDLLSETGLSVDDLLREVERIPSRRKAVILASCHSGNGKSQLTDALEKALAEHKAALPALEEVSEATVVLTAAAFGESAREAEELGHDIYTHFLIDALSHGDRDGDGAVTASEAHDWARERTYRYTQGKQRPTSESDILGKDPIVLAGAPTRPGKPVLYSYAASAEGLSVLVDGAAKGVLPGGVAVEPGRHALELQDGRGGALPRQRHGGRGRARRAVQAHPAQVRAGGDGRGRRAADVLRRDSLELPPRDVGGGREVPGSQLAGAGAALARPGGAPGLEGDRGGVRRGAALPHQRHALRDRRWLRFLPGRVLQRRAGAGAGDALAGQGHRRGAAGLSRSGVATWGHRCNRGGC